MNNILLARITTTIAALKHLERSNNVAQDQNLLSLFFQDPNSKEDSIVYTLKIILLCLIWSFESAASTTRQQLHEEVQLGGEACYNVLC